MKHIEFGRPFAPLASEYVPRLTENNPMPRRLRALRMMVLLRESHFSGAAHPAATLLVRLGTSRVPGAGCRQLSAIRDEKWALTSRGN